MQICKVKNSVFSEFRKYGLLIKFVFDRQANQTASQLDSDYTADPKKPILSQGSTLGMFVVFYFMFWLFLVGGHFENLRLRTKLSKTIIAD